MNRLIVESSTSRASVALFSGKELLVEEVFPAGRGPVSPLFSLVEKLLKAVDSIGEIIVGVGPGSYSGIRIGISAVIGLKLARNITAYGVVSTLGFPGEGYQVILDARGNWVYSAISNGKITIAPVNCTWEELLAQVDDRIPVYTPDLVKNLTVLKAFPLASILGRRYLAGHAVAQPLRPLYLKQPHITVAKAAPLL